jgi:hypothetical protein
VSVDVPAKGQLGHRPAAWVDGELVVLHEFGCDWGEAVDANDAGTVLIVGYVGHRCHAVEWNPCAGTTDVIGERSGVYPASIDADGTVLGTARNAEAESIALVARPGEGWQRLGTPAGFHATVMNNLGDVVGTTAVDGYARPWLWRPSGEVVWLPFLEHHHCRPYGMNGSRTVVGGANADHGSHALVWTPLVR